MDYTKNYHLPQWVKSDRIMMDDFNQMCKDLESGITNAQSTASAAQSAASRAQSTANTAQTTANRAQAAADTLPYAVGTYTGNGGDSQSIITGFRPSFLIISGIREVSGGGTTFELSDTGCITSGHTISKHVVFTETGFTVYKEPEGGGTKPLLNYIQRVYDYIAFR